MRTLTYWRAYRQAMTRLRALTFVEQGWFRHSSDWQTAIRQTYTFEAEIDRRLEAETDE